MLICARSAFGWRAGHERAGHGFLPGVIPPPHGFAEEHGLSLVGWDEIVGNGVHRQVHARPAVGRFVRMLTEGYRWSGNGAVHFWQMQDVATGQYDANAPRAVFCRQWDWNFW